MKELEFELQSILPAGFSESRPFVIAGPCSAESEKQVISAAIALATKDVKIFRAGIWKPRTQPGGFEGAGSKGLQWLKQVKAETGMYLSTEVATRNHVFEALKAGIDILWIGARTVANPFAVQEIADALQGTDIPVLIKNPVNPDINLWIGAIERIHRAGIHRIGAIHRGFSSYEKHMYRNQPLWQIPMELRSRYPKLPIICDPSHIGGKREFIAPLSQQAVDLKFDGLMIEAHENPDEAWSDAQQQITPDALDELLNLLGIRNTVQKNENITDLRRQIDHIDENLLELLAKRMHISYKIGVYKKDNNISFLQSSRFGEIVESRKKMGASMGLNADFIKRIMCEIHEESVHKQMFINNEL